MNNSSRASPPPPLNLASLPPNTFDMEKIGSAGSEAVSIPTTASRSASYSSESSFSASTPNSMRKSSTGFIRSSPPVNVHTTCGRHTDQFFFSGPSLKDLAKSLKKKF